MEPRTDHSDPVRTEDEIARELIERIAREVDLESGRKPIEGEPSASWPEASAEETVDERAVAADKAAEQPAERSEEDVARELVERIAREVDEESRG